MLALRWLKPKKGEGFVSLIGAFSLLGITLGVAALIVTLSVMKGFQRDITERLLAFSGHVLVYDATLEKEVAELPMVKSSFVVTQTQGLAVGRAGYNTGVVVRAFRPQNLRELDMTFTPEISQGLENGQALLGEKLANRLRVESGGSFTLLSPQPSTTLFGAAPRLMRFEVASVFKAGNYQYDNFYLFITAEDAAELFSRISPHLEVFLRDPYQVVAAERAITEIAPNALIDNWQNRNKELFIALAVERRVMTIILALIILVASFNIISGLVIQIKNHAKELAVLRSLGCSKFSILRIVMLNGILLGAAGVTGGIAVGLAVARNLEAIRRRIESWVGSDLFAEEIYLLSRLPVDVRLGDVTAVALATLLMAALASFAPAWRAAARPPSRGLRNE